MGEYVRFSEVAFFHKPSRSLLVTDAVVFVPEEPPEVISTKAGRLAVILVTCSSCLSVELSETRHV